MLQTNCVPFWLQLLPLTELEKIVLHWHHPYWFNPKKINNLLEETRCKTYNMSCNLKQANITSTTTSPVKDNPRRFLACWFMKSSKHIPVNLEAKKWLKPYNSLYGIYTKYGCKPAKILPYQATRDNTPLWMDYLSVKILNDFFSYTLCGYQTSIFTYLWPVHGTNYLHQWRRAIQKM